LSTDNGLLLDASAITAYILNEEGSEQIRIVMRRSISEGGRVATLPLAFKEVANALPLELAEQDKDLLQRAMRMSLDSKLPVYDTLYIAAAEKEHSTLVTTDRRQYAVAVQQVRVKLI